MYVFFINLLRCQNYTNSRILVITICDIYLQHLLRKREIHTYYKPGGHRTIIKDINSCHVWQPKPEESDLSHSSKYYIKETVHQLVDCEDKRVPVHQLVYFLHKGKVPKYPQVISHICHNERCTNIHHLSLERQQVNKKRQKCCRIRRCIGHGSKPKCKLF